MSRERISLFHERISFDLLLLVFAKKRHLLNMKCAYHTKTASSQNKILLFFLIKMQHFGLRLAADISRGGNKFLKGLDKHPQNWVIMRGL